MTKAQEIQILIKAVNTLGIYSYCGEWLRDQIPHIEHDMRCDILPTSSWSETRRLHDGMLNAAREQANYIIKNANEKGGKIIGDAQKHSENTRRMLARDIQKALDSIV
jgi:cell division septum initiation protein DivIVA